MPCYHPLKAWRIGTNPSGKPSYKITSYDAIAVEHDLDRDIWLPVMEDDYFFKNRNLFPTRRFNTDFLEIPCGKCIGCRLHYSAEWAQRCMLEASKHEKNCFITLTYDDEHLPDCDILCNDDGVVIGDSPFHPLVKDHFRTFIKNFRQRLVDNYKREHPDWCTDDLPRIRFFGCGEYGTESKRPHYHAIIFGYNFDADRYCFRKNFRGDSLYRSPLLESLWNYGISSVAECNFDTCAYVARYILKKQKGEGAQIYEDLNFPPEFTLMSRRPGIAREYYNEHRDKIYKNQEIFIADPKKGSLKLKPSRYYDRLYDLDFPDRMKEIKEKRLERAKQANRKRDELTSLSHSDLLLLQEDVYLNKTKILKERRCDF